MTTDFLPRPRELKFMEGTCNARKLVRADYSGLSDGTAALMMEDFPRAAFAGRASGSARLVLAASRHPRPGRQPAPLPRGQAEACSIVVTPGRVDITGSDAAGVWQGFQTFLLMAQDTDGPIPCCQVRDWPAIRWRGIHIDLKGYQPTFDRLVEMIRLLARYKVNAILLELEDKFAYTHAPGVGISSAYTPAQLRNLNDLAAAMHVQIIPKIQCLAHVDYLLKHPRYAHLRENGHPYQYCPRNPDVHKLWRAMAGEVMACLPDHEFLHVGGDESGHLGECPVCRRHSKAENYVHVVGKALDFVRQQGRQPIMWEDILRNLHGHLRPEELESTYVLGRKAILMYWAYGYGGEHDNNFSVLPTYTKRNMRVWGASGYSGCGPRWFQPIPDIQNRAWNIAAWTKTAVENGLEGVMTTGWTRIASFDPPTEIPEACWFQMLYAADSMWTGRSREVNEFCQCAARSFFGVELPEHVAFLMNLDLGKLPANHRRFKAARQADRLEVLNTAVDVFRHEQVRLAHGLSIYEVRHAYQKLVGHRIADYRKGLFEGVATHLKTAAAGQATAVRGVLSAFYEKPTVDEFVRTRFERDVEVADELLELTRQSSLL